MTSTAPYDVELLRSRMTGVIARPGEPGYDEGRSTFDGAVERRPAVVARCADPADVALALGYAREAGLEVSVRGGGHGHHLASGPELLIDLSPCASVRVDPERRRAYVGGGATLGALDAACHEHGLAVPAGTVSHTGIGGLTLGGGFGFLTSSFGLSIDNLESADVVLADGRCVRASAESEPDLFWAIRGGGGNFGVVTDFEFRLHPVGMPTLAALYYEDVRAAEAIRAARDLVPESRDLACVLGMLTTPPDPQIPEPHRGAPMAIVVVVGFGSPEEHAAAIAPLWEAMPPAFELSTPIPYVALQQMLDVASPWGINTHTKGLYFEDLPDDAIDVVVRQHRAKAEPTSRVMLFGMGPGYRAVADDATAFGGSRTARFAVAIEAVTPDPAALAAGRDWARETWGLLRPFAADASGYVNLDVGMDAERIRTTYGEKYDRLARIKAEYDPGNVFHVNANIKPA